MLTRGAASIETIVSGGDDYEILCAVPENRFEAFAQAAGRAGVAVTSIGTVIAGPSVPKFLDAQGREIALQRLSYSHF
jgi:thiamine-monophosphate kinase